VLDPKNQVIGAIFKDEFGDMVKVCPEESLFSCKGCTYLQNGFCVNNCVKWLLHCETSSNGSKIIFKPYTPDEPRMKRIANWQNKDLTCSNCESKLSVKYEFQSKTYCNVCIFAAIASEANVRLSEKS